MSNAHQQQQNVLDPRLGTPGPPPPPPPPPQHPHSDGAQQQRQPILPPPPSFGAAPRSDSLRGPPGGGPPTSQNNPYYHYPSPQTTSGQPSGGQSIANSAQPSPAHQLVYQQAPAQAAASPPHGGDDHGDDAKRPRACEACRGLKVRCDQDPAFPDQPCRRCAKAGRQCVITEPSRKRQKKSDSRVAELEKKLDALTAALQQSQQSGIPQYGPPAAAQPHPSTVPPAGYDGAFDQYQAS